MIRESIYLEVFLQMYDKWRTGKYYSSRGLLEITEMKIPHLVNAIASLDKKREERYAAVMALIPDGDIVNAAQDLYKRKEDVMSLKIKELKEELDKRTKE